MSLPDRLFPGVLICLLCGCASSPKPIGGKFNPHYERATINLQARIAHAITVVPLRVGDVRDVDGQCLIISQDTIRAVGKNGKENWSATTADRATLNWEGEGSGIAYFTALHMDAADKSQKEDSPLQLRRFDIKSHRWLSPLRLESQAKADEDYGVISVLADEKRLAVLTSRGPVDGAPVERRLRFFSKGNDKPLWSKVFSGSGSLPDPGVRLLAPSRPEFASSDIVHLSWLEDGILVCAGEQADVICLGPGGDMRWKVSRIGEYQRGFIGPSMYSHYIGRFGFDWGDIETLQKPDAGLTKDEREYAAELRKNYARARDAFDRDYTWGIVAGPVIVPGSTDGSGPSTPTVFVVVARGPNAQYAGYLSDAIAYEISADDMNSSSKEVSPKTMCQLPRMPIGSLFLPVKDGVVWACQDGAMARIGVSGFGRDKMFGPDCLTNVVWYRQFHAPSVTSVLSADPAGEWTEFNGGYALHITRGGYVRSLRGDVYCFPIECVNLCDGTSRTATLRVPFDGVIRLPKTNYSGGEGSMHAYGAYQLGLTRIIWRGKCLELWLATEKSAVSLNFDVDELLK